MTTETELLALQRETSIYAALKALEVGYFGVDLPETFLANNKVIIMVDHPCNVLKGSR